MTAKRRNNARPSIRPVTLGPSLTRVAAELRARACLAERNLWKELLLLLFFLGKGRRKGAGCSALAEAPTAECSSLAEPEAGFVLSAPSFCQIVLLANISHIAREGRHQGRHHHVRGHGDIGLLDGDMEVFCSGGNHREIHEAAQAEKHAAVMMRIRVLATTYT